MDAFYTRTGEGSYASHLPTAGPWDAGAQHAGPPSALLLREIELASGRPELRTGRLHVDVLGPVPVAPVRVEVRTLRTGRSVELLEATLLTEVAAGERPVLVGRAWRLLPPPADGPVADVPASMGEPVPGPAAVDFPGAFLEGYLAATDWRFVRGGFDQHGPAVAWARPRVDLVAGEPTTGLQRLVLLADSGSGASLVADPRRFPAISCDLSVLVDREPVGEWLGLDARTAITPGSGGITTTELHDLGGRVGSSSQVLFVREV